MDAGLVLKAIIRKETGSKSAAKVRQDKQIPAMGGFQDQWVKACKGDLKTSCNFDYGGTLIEQLLLGLVAYRAGKKIQYDGDAGRVTKASLLESQVQYDVAVRDREKLESIVPIRRIVLNSLLGRPVDAPIDVRQLIASRLTTHARELSGAVCRLQATSEALSRPINAAMAEDILAEMARHCGRGVCLGDIERAVCDVFGVEPVSLHSGDKAQRVSHPRMLAMWLARKHTRAALSEIGHFFGRRTHSTVASAQKRVDGWMAAGTTLRIADGQGVVDEAIRRVERQLRAS